MPRISRDDMFIQIAKIYAERSTCDRAHVGAILVNRHHRIISTGYNGSGPGKDHCDDVGHKLKDNHCIRTIHAEENCIEYLAKGVKYRAFECTLYLTHSPCIHCATLIIRRLPRVGITRIVYLNQYDTFGIKMLEKAGVKVERYQE